MGPSHRTTPPDLAGLFREHAAGLAGAVRGVLGPRADVQEVLQEVFLKTWRVQLEGRLPEEPVAWIFVTTLNLCRDQRRRRQRRGQALDLDEVDDVNLATSESEPVTRMAGEETLAAARAAIHGLQDPEKQVFLLRTSGELSFAAVAEALGIPVGTAKTRMRSALANLRRQLDLEGESR